MGSIPDAFASNVKALGAATVALSEVDWQAFEAHLAAKDAASVHPSLESYRSMDVMLDRRLRAAAQELLGVMATKMQLAQDIDQLPEELAPADLPDSHPAGGPLTLEPADLASLPDLPPELAASSAVPPCAPKPTEALVELPRRPRWGAPWGC